MFGSLFSNRYNKKREIFYAQYEETRERYSNLPIYKRPKEPLSCKSPKYSRRKRKPADYDYDECCQLHESRLECNMCCKHFGQNCELQLHSLDDCRKYLLATLSN
ncbi:uncharacterized protein LOC115761478 [Drosophila novamexicana]|uniref:uncharacterized protein LOC115761478 n=1 Tax=Drosophila novamexicana TaxID=47314 RepID=UPI0011E59561|nr:uncharacterized protein LOC115761478 [Drosophila novamexicana]